MSAVQQHWPEYLMEAAELGTFMLSACAFTAIFEHPFSPIHAIVPHPMWRRVLIGTAMGLTAICLIYSRWGKRSGAHLNPGVTLAFYTLRKIHGWDALFYVLAQFVGGMAGVDLAALLIGAPLGHPSVNYAVTMPGPGGPWVAFAAEFSIAFLMITTVLTFSNSKRLTRWTPLMAGTLVAAFISFEAPLSGMSMNPARSLGSAVAAQSFSSLWIYFTAPVAGMLLGAKLHVLRYGAHSILCAKLHHHNNHRCIFRCKYGALDSCTTT